MQRVITWLNANSNAVEALGSVAAVLVSLGSLSVTIVLARLTRKYVALTNTIAAATQAQAVQTMLDGELQGTLWNIPLVDAAGTPGAIGLYLAEKYGQAKLIALYEAFQTSTSNAW